MEKPLRSVRRVALALGAALLGVGLFAAAELSFPALSGPVVDQAGILATATVRELAYELRADQAAHGRQLVVVTLASLEGREIEDYGYRLGRHWGIGDADRDDGALLIVAPDEHAVRIEVGRGLEGTLTDALCRVIIEREILPRFKHGDYDGGVRAGVAAILAVLGGEGYAPPPERDDGPVPAIVILLLFVVFLIVMHRFGRALGSGRYGGGFGGGLGGGIGSGGFGGGFGGGGYGGGGGGFSGGGASGHW